VDDNDFLGLVPTRTGMSSEQGHRRHTRATLTTLAERIDGGEARDLASQPPAGLRAYAFGGVRPPSDSGSTCAPFVRRPGLSGSTGPR
jgi:uncharacterized protein (DUF2267 family)